MRDYQPRPVPDRNLALDPLRAASVTDAFPVVMAVDPIDETTLTARE